MEKTGIGEQFSSVSVLLRLKFYRSRIVKFFGGNIYKINIRKNLTDIS